MTYWTNIAKALTNLFGRLQLLPLGGRLGGGFLLVALLLLAGPRFAHAQNTGTAPYLDSEHAYQVKIGKAANAKRWVVTDKDVTTPITHTITNATQGLFDWFSITPALTNGGNEQVTIFFDRTVFTHDGNWYLQYYEDEDIGGSLVCISAREFGINITENTFYLLVGDNTSQCNDESDSIHTYAQVDDDPAGSDLFPTEVTYTVTMNKGADFLPTNFSFDATFSQAAVAASFSVGMETTGGGTAGFTENAGVYTVTVIPVPFGQFPNQVELSLTVSFNNPVLVNATPQLTVSNGQAVVAGTPPAITYDNEAIYPVAPGNPGDRTQAITIQSIPATRDIGPGENETAWSTQNPLRNSTHKYTVQMADITRWNQGTSGWHIKLATGGGAIAPGPTTYAINRNQSPTNDTATIVFYFDPDVESDYILYFTEEGSNGCSTVRAHPFTIMPPFDVDIAVATSNCATISNNVNNTPLVATPTIVNYTVNLITTGYRANWSFDFALGSNPAFLAPNLTVTAITTNTTGAIYTSGSVAVTNSEADPVSTVVVQVTYSGIYDSEHNITAALSNITGSYAEVDVDGAGNDNTIHTIYRMPQAGVLAGVD